VKSLRSIFIGAVALAGAAVASAMTMIYPVEAIDDLWMLGADDFREKYSGINISGLSPSDEGWFVRYRHENLTYLFGPVADREEARRKKWEMEAVRDAAIRNRATLASSQVDYVRFTYSGVFGHTGGNVPYDGSGPRISADGRSGPDGDLDGDGIPNALDDDMDGDGIPNDQDGDMDGDGIPNAIDDYRYGTNPAGEHLGQDGGAGQGQGSSGDADRMAGADGQERGQDGQQRGQDGSQQGGQQQMAGAQGSESGQQGQQGQRRVASSQRGQQSSQSGQQGQQGQPGQPGQPSSSQSSSSGQAGDPSSSSSSSASPSSTNPLLALLRMILGI
jgi:hypothetical protein